MRILFVSLFAIGIFNACQPNVNLGASADAPQLAVQSAAMVSEDLANWNGEYVAYFSYGKIGGVNAGWELTIKISADSIIATGEGYQMYFKDALKAVPGQNKLTLIHLKHLEGYQQGNKMKPEFTIVKDKGNFYIKSDWIGLDVLEKPKANGYLIEKVK